MYQSVQSTVTLIDQNNIEIQHSALQYLEWLLINTHNILKLNFNQIQPLITSTLKVLVKKYPSMDGQLLNLLNCLNKMSDENTNRKLNESNTLQEDIIAFISEQYESIDINQSLQHLKQKVSIIIYL